MPLVAEPPTARLTTSAAVVEPVRVTVNVPVFGGVASPAFASLAVMLTVGVAAFVAVNCSQSTLPMSPPAVVSNMNRKTCVPAGITMPVFVTVV